MCPCCCLLMSVKLSTHTPPRVLRGLVYSRHPINTLLVGVGERGDSAEGTQKTWWGGSQLAPADAAT